MNYMIIKSIIYLLATSYVFANEQSSSSQNNETGILTCLLLKKLEETSELFKLRTSTGECDKMGHRVQSECENPTNKELAKKLLDFEESISIGIQLSPTQNVLSSLGHLIVDDIHFNDTIYYGSKNCHSKTHIEDFQQGICPWHYHVTYRDDRYPLLQMNAKCNCDKCDYIEIKDDDAFLEYKCRPLKKLKTVLIRGKCFNGKYEWIPALEYTSEACICMSQYIEAIF
jgi:hypothetical protein